MKIASASKVSAKCFISLSFVLTNWVAGARAGSFRNGNITASLNRVLKCSQNQMIHEAPDNSGFVKPIGKEFSGQPQKPDLMRALKEVESILAKLSDLELVTLYPSPYLCT